MQVDRVDVLEGTRRKRANRNHREKMVEIYSGLVHRDDE